jgi:xylulokinase
VKERITMGKYLVGIDEGTTGCKACVFDVDGKLLGSAYKEYPCYYPQSIWVEQLEGDMVPALYETTKNAIKKSGVDPKDILAISLSSQGGTFGLVDESGRTIRPFLVWQDLRGAPETKYITDRISMEEFYKIAGNPILVLLAITKLLWLKHNETDNFNKAYKYVDHQDFFLRAFGMKDYLTDSSSAQRFGFFDIDNEKYSQKLIDLVGVPESKLPQVVQSGTKVGTIPKNVAEQTGLLEGTPIIMGSMDCTCSTFGCGGTDSGTAVVIMGTYGACFSISDKPVRDPNGNMMVKANSGMGNFTMEGSSNTSASSYRWYRDVFCDNEKFAAGLVHTDPYQLINIQIEDVPPGANGVTFLPYLQGRSGEKLNEKARGAFIGMTLGTTKADIARAVMEGISYETYDTINGHAAAGTDMRAVRLTGGATKSPMWCQMLADIFKMPVQLPEVSETGCLGAAMYAGVGAGVYKDCRDAARKVVKLGSVYEPNPEKAAAYEEAYKRYQSYYDAMELGKIW